MASALKTPHHIPRERTMPFMSDRLNVDTKKRENDQQSSDAIHRAQCCLFIEDCHSAWTEFRSHICYQYMLWRLYGSNGTVGVGWCSIDIANLATTEFYWSSSIINWNIICLIMPKTGFCIEMTFTSDTQVRSSLHGYDRERGDGERDPREPEVTSWKAAGWWTFSFNTSTPPLMPITAHDVTSDKPVTNQFSLNSYQLPKQSSFYILRPGYWQNQIIIPAYQQQRRPMLWNTFPGNNEQN